MTYDEVKRFLHKKIIVTDIDGNRIKGIFTNTVSEYGHIVWKRRNRTRCRESILWNSAR